MPNLNVITTNLPFKPGEECPASDDVAESPVTVIFNQAGEHLHTWETDFTHISIPMLLEAVCSTGMVEYDQDVEVLVYDDTNEDTEPLMQLTLSAKLISGDYPT